MGIVSIVHSAYRQAINEETTRILLTLVPSTASAAPVWAGFEERLTVYEGGNHATTLNEWRPLAEQGNPTAQPGVSYVASMQTGITQPRRAL
jgi:hypothetical protein